MLTSTEGQIKATQASALTYRSGMNYGCDIVIYDDRNGNMAAEEISSKRPHGKFCVHVIPQKTGSESAFLSSALVGMVRATHLAGKQTLLCSTITAKKDIQEKDSRNSNFCLRCAERTVLPKLNTCIHCTQFIRVRWLCTPFSQDGD